MNLAVIGTGYVGLVTGACLAEMGNQVLCVDVDAGKVEALGRGVIPFHEPGLESLVKENLDEGRLKFTTSLKEAVSVADIFMIAVGTPAGEDGSADLGHVTEVARQIGQLMTRRTLIITKSTVPVGTAEKVREVIRKELETRGLDLDFDVVSNPEFLKEGAAVEDFMRPDRIIVGCEDEQSRAVMREIYAPFTRSHERMIFMPTRAAEMTKYAANAMLATRISFINEMAALCDRLGVDVESVRLGIGSDARIGYSFIYPGCGFGGSCFPKDIKALLYMSNEAGFDPLVLRAVKERNDEQKNVLFRKVAAVFGRDLSNKSFCLWGLAFKPGTDDMREAPSEVLLAELIGAGARVVAYDPAAMEIARGKLPAEWFSSGSLRLADGQYEALEGADALLLVTEWKSFRHPDFARMKKLLASPVVFDGRNQYEPAQMSRLGFRYLGIGRGEATL